MNELSPIEIGIPKPAIDRLAASQQGEIATLRGLAENLVVTEATAKDATDILGMVKRAKDAAEEARVSWTKPLVTAQRSVNDWFKGLVAPLDEIDQSVRQKIGAWQQVQAKIRQDALDKLRAEAAERQRLDDLERHRLEVLAAEDDVQAALGTEAPLLDAVGTQGAKVTFPVARAVILPPAPTVRSSGTTVSTRKVWKFAVEDINAVPREYLVVDETAIRRAVAAGTRSIAGVRIYEDAEVTVRTR